MNILVFPCGSEIGLEIYRSLKKNKHFNLIGGSSVKDHGDFVYPEIIDLPNVDNENFIKEINEACEAYNIKYIFPAHDSVVLKLAESEVKAEVLTSPVETCKICRSKRKTYALFAGLLPVPISFKIKYPVFLKPDVGQGSKGCKIVHTKQELTYHLLKDRSLLILEYLPGKEYTIDCFTNKEGKLLFAEGRERVRIKDGISVNSKPIRDAEFQRMAEVINSTLKFRGVWFFQVKESERGDFVLMEIAPRIAGTMALYRCQGVNLAELTIWDREGKDVEILQNDFHIEIDRALEAKYKLTISYKRVYLDLDDTLLIAGEINTDVVKLIFQVKAEGKKLCLITRHCGSVRKFLSRYYLDSTVFDEIIFVGEGHTKSQYIEKDSIFIDDSFAERKEVFTKRRIPVFSVDAVECLIK